MSFDIVQSIIKPIIRPIVSAFKRWYLDLNNNSILMPVYTPKSANGTLRTSVRFDASDIGQSVVLLADNDSLTERLFKDTDDTIKFGYIDSDGTSRTASSPTVVVAGVDYHPTVRFDGNGVTVDVAGASDSNPNSIDPSDLNLIRMASNNTGTGNFLNGRQWNTGFTDDTFIQNGEFLQGNGVDLYGQVSPVVLADDLRLTCWVRAVDGDIRMLARSQDFDTEFGINANGLVFNTEIGSTNFPEFPRAYFVTGQDYKIVVTRIAGIVVATIDNDESAGAGNAGSFNFNSMYRASSTYSSQVMADILVENLTAGQTYQYLLNNIINNGDGTATAPQTGSVPRFGDELWNPSSVTTFGESAYNQSSNVAEIVSSDGSDSGVTLTGILELGKVYRVTGVADIRSGELRVGDSVGVDGVISESGPFEVYFVANATVAIVKRQSGITDITASAISYVETTDALIQNFDSSALVAMPQISRFYPMDDGEGTNIRDTLNPSGTTDATVDVGAVTWVRD